MADPFAPLVTVPVIPPVPTVKVTALLEAPPTPTVTGPVVAPLGTGTTIVVSLHRVGDADIPLKFTVLPF